MAVRTNEIYRDALLSKNVALCPVFKRINVYKRALVICQARMKAAAAGGGNVASVWPRVEEAFRDALPPAPTTHPRHAHRDTADVTHILQIIAFGSGRSPRFS